MNQPKRRNGVVEGVWNRQDPTAVGGGGGKRKWGSSVSRGKKG